MATWGVQEQTPGAVHEPKPPPVVVQKEPVTSPLQVPSSKPEPLGSQVWAAVQAEVTDR